MDSQILEFIDILRDNTIDYRNKKRLTDFLFIIPKRKVRQVMTLNGYANINDLSSYLNSHYANFKMAYITNNYYENERVKDELIHQILPVKSNIITLKEKSKSLPEQNESLYDVKIQYCEKTIEFLKKQVNKDSPKTKSTRSTNVSELKQNQVVILFYHLKQLGDVGKDLPKNVYANHISKLTGFNDEKIRQGLSNISNDSMSSDKMRFLETDYSGIKRALKTLIDEIDKDCKEKYPISS